MESKFYIKTTPLSDPRSNFRGFDPGTRVLPKGYVHVPGAKPLNCEILLERDAAIPMRDGAVLRADIFRPNDDEKVPAILCASIFGKNGSYANYDFCAKMFGHPNRMNVPLGTLSELNMFEATDPAWWVEHHYAVINLDIRGVGMSQGRAHYFDSQDAMDNYDAIEWLARQSWCSGKVTMQGNSWLGITQWYAAAARPPHLCCIAPWEGHANMYVDEYMRGGIPRFAVQREEMCFGNYEMEDLRAEMMAYPLYNDFWRDKAADFARIDIPVYAVASYGSQVHVRGTFEGFRSIASKEKWLRVHNTQEWPDQYRPENLEDLLKFYDHYCKGIDNGWENTPTIRMCVLDPGGEDILYRPETEFPLARQELKKLYLNAETLSLDPQAPPGESKVSYVSDDGRTLLQFRYTFTEETEITGYLKLKLWLAAEDNIDADVFARAAKKSAQGEYLSIGAGTSRYSGPNTMLRASLRELDEVKSTPCEPFHTFTRPRLLTKGKPVELELGFWPTALIFHPGQVLELTIAGFDYLSENAPKDVVADTRNRGRHTVYTGGDYDSYLLLPVIPKD